MRSARIAILASLISTLAVPAAAQDDPAATANAAFVRGANSGITPQTTGEETDCFVYWSMWRFAIDNKLVPGDLVAGLPSDLQLAAATDKSDRWAGRLRAASGGEKALAAVRNSEPRVRTQIADGLTGDTAKLRNLFETLAICRNPDVPR